LEWYQYLIKKGKECIDLDEPLFQITAITTHDPNCNILLFSISHTLADGYNFYNTNNNLQ
jgi:hypothetical protein